MSSLPTFPRFQPSKWKSLTRYSTTKSQSSWRYVYLRTSRKGDYPFDTCCVRFCFGRSLSLSFSVYVPSCLFVFMHLFSYTVFLSTTVPVFFLTLFYSTAPTKRERFARPAQGQDGSSFVHIVHRRGATTNSGTKVWPSVRR